MTICGRLGIGGVEGEYNASGSYLRGTGGQDRTRVDTDESTAEAAILAVEALQSSMVGMRTEKSPHSYRTSSGHEHVTLRHATVVSELSDTVRVHFFGDTGECSVLVANGWRRRQTCWRCARS